MKSKEMLLKRYDYIHRMYTESERTFTTWDSLFPVTQGILISVLIQLIIYNASILTICAVADVGIIIAFFWFLIQSRAFAFSLARIKLLREIENELKKSKIEFDPINEEREKLDKMELSWDKRISTWKLRRVLPWMFIVIWIILLFSRF